MPKAELFTIGEFSAMTGVGIHSLRYYDEIGAETAPVLSGSFPRKPAGIGSTSPRQCAALCRQKRSTISLCAFSQVAADSDEPADRNRGVRGRTR